MSKTKFTPEEDQLLLGCVARGDIAALAEKLGYPHQKLLNRRRTLQIRTDLRKKAEAPPPAANPRIARPDWFNENIGDRVRSGR